MKIKITEIIEDLKEDLESLGIEIQKIEIDFVENNISIKFSEDSVEYLEDFELRKKLEGKIEKILRKIYESILSNFRKLGAKVISIKWDIINNPNGYIKVKSPFGEIFEGEIIKTYSSLEENLIKKFFIF